MIRLVLKLLLEQLYRLLRINHYSISHLCYKFLFLILARVSIKTFLQVMIHIDIDHIAYIPHVFKQKLDLRPGK